MTNPNHPTQTEISAGGCVYKLESGDDHWLLGKHSGYHKWVLPKGRIESGETPQQTAIRETQEELAVTAKIVGSKPIHTLHYTYQATLKSQNTSTRRVASYQENQSFDPHQAILIHKTVHFFLMEYVSGDPRDHGWEMAAAGWFSYEEALGKLAFDSEKAALTQAHDKMLELKLDNA